MKTIKALFVFAITSTFTTVANAQSYNYKLDGPFTATSTFKVNGSCDMCKHRIETSMKGMPGVWSVYWDVNSQTALVKYDRSRINIGKIEKVIAQAGHDTENFRAKDEVFAGLPDCCHYQRKS